jgi:ATP-dependent RNA helicase DDX55/SPB4
MPLFPQIHSVAEPFIVSIKEGTVQLLVGGADPSEDVVKFKSQGAWLIIGTPGRIDDMIKRCSSLMDLKRVEMLVLDEADRLLEMGFRLQLDSIMSRLPRQRRTGLFSATQTEAVQALARAGLRNPVRVNVAVHVQPQAAPQPKDGKASKAKATPASDPDPSQVAPSVQKTPTGLHIEYSLCEADEKLGRMIRFLKDHPTEKIIVYFSTCCCVDFFHLALKRLGPKILGPDFKLFALHGKMKQASRESTLYDYSSIDGGCLLCTDLAARGLDIPDVSWVLQFDPPQDPSSFVHRVGRTARMGKSGRALVYLLPQESSYVNFLNLRKVPLIEAEDQGEVADVIALLRKEAEEDREVMEAGTKAFVSYVRGYKEHHCKFIFRIQDLSLGRLATSFALLRLPRMPELKKVNKGSIEHFTPSSVDPETVRFKDKGREKQRQQFIIQRSQEMADSAKDEEKKKREGKKEVAKGGVVNHGAGERLTAAKRRKLQQRDELEELDHEYTLLKKLKKGKLSEHEFDVATGLSEDDEKVEVEERGGKDEERRHHGTGLGAKSSKVVKALTKKQKKKTKKSGNAK